MEEWSTRTRENILLCPLHCIAICMGTVEYLNMAAFEYYSPSTTPQYPVPFPAFPKITLAPRSSLSLGLELNKGALRSCQEIQPYAVVVLASRASGPLMFLSMHVLLPLCQTTDTV